MGIITYQFHKTNDLSPQRFDVMFLDMGENIHLHYRDLRIEMSVEEFREFEELFSRYKEGVLGEIAAGYRDGVLPNTNEVATIKTFWDKQKLQHPAKYDENLIAIEETTDGYHIHLRNYKFLVDLNSFTRIARAFAKSLHLLEDGTLQRDPLFLLQINHLEPRLLTKTVSETGEETRIAVQEKFRRKSAQVLIGLGYHLVSGNASPMVFEKDNARIILSPPGGSSAAMTKLSNEPEVISLPDFLAGAAKSLDRQAINTCKLHVLSLLKRAELQMIPPFSLDDLHVNRHTLALALDLFAERASVAPRTEYDRFNRLLVANQLFFIKPQKSPFGEEERERLFERFVDHVARELAPVPCISRIYLAGSGTRKDSGRYQVPFVHFEWCKLASDFDIIIEIDPDREKEIPSEWDFKFPWAKHSAHYYHLGDLGHGMDSPYAGEYPGIVFYEHLLEAYLFLPSKVVPKLKEAYYETIKPTLIHQKDTIVSWFEQQYGVDVVNMKLFGAKSFNKIYQVDTKTGAFALKVYDNSYINNDDPSRIQYEIDILQALQQAGLPVSSPIANSAGDWITERGRDKVVLFQYVAGFFVGKAKEQEARTSGALLARLHTSLADHVSVCQGKFDIRRPLFLWLKEYEKYRKNGTIGEGPDSAPFRQELEKLASWSVHCHGDVSPRNYLFTREGDCAMIDFQNLGYGPAVIDLTDGMVEFASQDGAFHWEVLRAFRKGYEEVRHLADDEVEALENLLACHLIIKQTRLYRNHLVFALELKTDKIAGLAGALADVLAGRAAFVDQ